MKIRVEVVYVQAHAQEVVVLELKQGARVADALAATGLSGRHTARNYVGIWGALVSPETELRDRDRIEIYRELVADPKHARRQRARQQRKPRR
jgi:putative ubiquitin-RnfH superfamily antitoxin RatB of RatAB toxin-antitoxin module